MFEEFKQEVFAAYKDLSNKHELPDEMESLTRFDLKRHSQRVLADRYDRKDDEVIRQFFDPQNRYANHEERIQHFELDGFRPLVLFMQERTRNPHERVVKILAWLIDFEPRPYAEWQRMRHGEREATNDSEVAPGGHQTAGTEIGGDKLKPEGPTLPPDPEPDTTKVPQIKRVWYFVGTAILLLSGMTIYFVISRPECLDKQCMHWFNDRYVAVCCGKQLPGVTVVALNPHELEHFRKITRTDTLTAAHANKVWYSKIDNNVEFFTAPAAHHPVYRDRSLKAATVGIIEKYAGRHRRSD